MGNDTFFDLCKREVVEYFNQHADKTDHKKITEDDVFIVWACKILQNNKALVSTTVPDGMYYEVTYDGDKQQAYVDIYKKWQNYSVIV
jgi:hypothetical protein